MLFKRLFASVSNLDRPPVLPEINATAKKLLADFGASDAPVPDVIFAKTKPGGKLPFELPSSMEAARSPKKIFLTIQRSHGKNLDMG